jgi:glyoxylase-like metal-dependent hydrolase (beta-lactamase superfamily II)
VRPGGNVLIDPLPMSEHDQSHLRELGGAALIVLTNSFHVRATRELAQAFGAKIAAPAAERAAFPIACDTWIGDGDTVFPGMTALALDGSKTAGELALVIDDTTLVCGDLVRAHRAGSLMLLLAEQGLKDRAAAAASVRRLAALPRIEAMLVGDGWCAFRDGHAQLETLAEQLAG